MRALLLVAVALLAACQQPPALQPPVTSATSPAASLRAEGDALMARADYAGAVEKFRQAIDLEPASVPLRFVLGTAYSFLDKRPEAIAQFRWVIANASRESIEYQEARGWLARIGVLVEEPGVRSAGTSADDDTKKSGPATAGSVGGQTRWPGVEPGHEPIPIRISLMGREEGTRHVGLRRDVSLGERFEFKDVPEGQYRLVGVFDDRIIWDRNVTVQSGKQTDVALDQGSSSVPAGYFPLPAAAPVR